MNDPSSLSSPWNENLRIERSAGAENAGAIAAGVGLEMRLIRYFSFILRHRPFI